MVGSPVLRRIAFWRLRIGTHSPSPSSLLLLLLLLLGTHSLSSSSSSGESSKLAGLPTRTLASPISANIWWNKYFLQTWKILVPAFTS